MCSSGRISVSICYAGLVNCVICAVPDQSWLSCVTFCCGRSSLLFWQRSPTCIYPQTHWWLLWFSHLWTSLLIFHLCISSFPDIAGDNQPAPHRDDHPLVFSCSVHVQCPGYSSSFSVVFYLICSVLGTHRELVMFETLENIYFFFQMHISSVVPVYLLL